MSTAREFAIKAHGDQKYGDNEPYVNHLDEVAAIALQYFHYWNTTEFHLVEDACYLHDVLEDTDTSEGELIKKFPYTFDIVVNVTDQPGANRKERKRNSWWRIRRDPKSIFVKLCDRLANTRRKGKIDMYRKEFPLFEAALYRPGQFEDLWEELRKETFK